MSVGYIGKRRAMVRMAELGARLVIVEEPGHWSESLVAEGLATGFIEAPVVGDPDIDTAAALEALAAEGVHPDGVVTFWEDSVPIAARIAQALGLPGNPPEAVDAARSKVRTRELMAELGLPSPKARRVRSLDELFAAAEEIGFPAVVKPEFGHSAMGCVRVDDVDSLPGIYSLVREIVTPETDSIFRAGNGMLLEQYLDGVEFDVDMVMQGEPACSPASPRTGPPSSPLSRKRACTVRPRTTSVRYAASSTSRSRPPSRSVSTTACCTSRASAPAGAADRRGERAHGRRADPRHRRGRLGGRPDRGPAAELAGPRARRQAQPSSPLRGRQRDRLPARLRDPDVDADLLARPGRDVVLRGGPLRGGRRVVTGTEETFATALAELTLMAKDVKTARTVADRVVRDHPVVVG